MEKKKKRKRAMVLQELHQLLHLRRLPHLLLHPLPLLLQYKQLAKSQAPGRL
jgi:hypothetical protein